MQHMPSFQVVDGQLQGARQVPSPNFNARPTDQEIQLLVIHNISLPPSQFGGGYIEPFFSESAGLVAASLFSDHSGYAGFGTFADFKNRRGAAIC